MKTYLLITAFIFSSFSSAFACSCMQWQNASEILNDSDVLILAIPSEDSLSVTPSDEINLKTNFSVVRNFKGSNDDKLTIFSWEDTGGNCGTQFKKDEGLILISAYMENGKLVTDMCSVSAAGYGDIITNKIIRDLINLTKR